METKQPKTYEEHLAEFGMTPDQMERYMAWKDFTHALRQTAPFVVVEWIVETMARATPRQRLLTACIFIPLFFLTVILSSL